MTTGFDQQPTTFGAILRTAPKPQTVGSKLAPPVRTEDRPLEPRSFHKRPTI